MKTIITYGQLWQMMQDIEHMQKEATALALFNNEKIKRFFKLNQYHCEKVTKKIMELADKYTAKDEEGKPAMVEENGEQHYVYESDEMEKKHVEEYNAFMQKTFEFNF